MSVYKNVCKVWSRFQVTKKDGSNIKLRIQDLECEKYKDAMDFFMKYLMKEEAFYKAAGISNNKEALAEYTELLDLVNEYEKPNISVCYIDDGSETNDIIGISVISDKKSQSDEDNFKDFKPKTKELQNLFNILEVTEDLKVSKGYETFYEGIGISVRPDHRGLGIASEFIRLRKQICIHNNVQVISAWMTAIGTQKAADKHNWKTFLELPVEELSRKTGLAFEVNIPTFKLMYTTKD